MKAYVVGMVVVASLLPQSGVAHADECLFPVPNVEVGVAVGPDGVTLCAPDRTINADQWGQPGTFIVTHCVEGEPCSWLLISLLATRVTYCERDSDGYALCRTVDVGPNQVAYEEEGRDSFLIGVRTYCNDTPSVYCDVWWGHFEDFDDPDEHVETHVVPGNRIDVSVTGTVDIERTGVSGEGAGQIGRVHLWIDGAPVTLHYSTADVWIGVSIDGTCQVGTCY